MANLKIYDCSLNSFSPEHRINSLGSKENDIMADLRKHQLDLSIDFVSDYKNADRIITNTTYTPYILKFAKENNIPLIKRMDGVFWREDLVERNVKLNEAAIQSNAVIFISKFSQDSFEVLYPNSKLKNTFIVLNNVDETIFHNKFHKKNIKFTWGTSATNWCREVKRPKDLLKFADFVGEHNERILLIGKSNIQHENIINAGYHHNYNKISNLINCADAWVNFSYRDAAPKTVLQAIKCNKPVLYANSGGLPELVQNFGIAIKDEGKIYFSDNNFELDFEEIQKSYYEFKNKFETFQFPFIKKYIETLKEYVNIIKNQ